MDARTGVCSLSFRTGELFLELSRQLEGISKLSFFEQERDTEETNMF
jgi:hypothetical protein